METKKEAPTRDNRDDRVKLVEFIINYRFTEPSILSEALCTPDASGPKPPSPFSDNRNLAMVGDAALQIIHVLCGYERATPRGKISRILSTKACNAFLAQRGFFHGFDQFISKSTQGGGVVGTKAMATAVEAIIGAVYLDGDHDNFTVIQVMDNLGLLVTSDY